MSLDRFLSRIYSEQQMLIIVLYPNLFILCELYIQVTLTKKPHGSDSENVYILCTETDVMR